MIEIVNDVEEYQNSKQNFIINIVGLNEEFNEKIARQYPHVEKEYLRYLKYCSKNGINIIGSIQYVPVDTWALIMCDTLKNNNVFAYDNDYQYIVNVYCPDGKITHKSVKICFAEIAETARKIGATIAVPWAKGLYKKYSNIMMLFGKCRELFEDVDVKIYSLN